MVNEHSKLPGIMYSAIQANLWMAYCLVSSFISIYLLYFGYSNSEIGFIVSIGSILAVLIQLVSAQILTDTENTIMEVYLLSNPYHLLPNSSVVWEKSRRSHYCNGDFSIFPDYLFAASY